MHVESTYALQAYWVRSNSTIDYNATRYSVLIGYRNSDLVDQLNGNLYVCLAGKVQGTKFELSGYNCDTTKFKYTACKKAGMARC